jgi:transketolase
VKGKGVDFMEDDVRWHYGGLDSDKIIEAKRYIETAVIG